MIIPIYIYIYICSYNNVLNILYCTQSGVSKQCENNDNIMLTRG